MIGDYMSKYKYPFTIVCIAILILAFSYGLIFFYSNEIKDNIGWFKDFCNVFFLIITMIIAILTYMRAKETILQPIRTESIKKQFEILERLFKEIKKIQNGEDIFDYIGIIEVNAIMQLHNLGFVFANNSELLTKAKEKFGGIIPFPQDGCTLKNSCIISTFDNYQEDFIEQSKQRYDEAKQGKLYIDEVYITNKNINFSKLLSDYMFNPFMPRKIINILEEIMKQYYANMQICRQEIENFVKEFFDSSKEVQARFNPIGIYNNFNHKKISHRGIILKLEKEIRNYLLIDKPWN